MRTLLAGLMVSVAVLAQTQDAPKPAAEPRPHLSVADFGLAYPLGTDWVRATKMVRKRTEADSPQQNFDVLLAAIYVPKSDIAANSPFFTLLAYRQPATDCKKNLEALSAHAQEIKAEGGVVQFSAAGRDYYRLNMAHGSGGRHGSMICTTANNHLLVWNAGAENEKGMDAIVSTLNSITPLPPQATSESMNDGDTPKLSSNSIAANPKKMEVPHGVMAGLLIKKVNPVYPPEARAAYIQGTVILQAEINKTGDIVDIELVDGPIELAGSAVAAVRQWKYRPYLLEGEPVTVDTQIQVNYALQKR